MASRRSERLTAISSTITQTNIELDGVRLVQRGKVRDVYEVDDRILLVATDRLSAFDCVLPTPIPHKGRVLTQISKFWFERMKDVVQNHMIATSVDDFPEVVEFYRMSGEIDYLLRVVVPDIAAYDAFYKKLISRIALTDVSSSFAMEQIKYTTALPLEFALVEGEDK